MRVRPESLDVSDSEPWALDSLDRKSFGEHLSVTLRKFFTPSTVGLIAPWGAGKSTFLRMLTASMRSEEGGPLMISFDAWLSDYAGEPLTAFIESFDKSLDADSATKASTELRKFKAAAKRVLVDVGAAALRGTKFVITGAVKNAAPHDPAASAAAAMTGAALDAAAAKVEKHAKANPKNREDFKKTLENIAQRIAADRKISEGRPSVFVCIDELDRCKPDFSIRLLEVIKHFFNVPGVVFLLAYDGEYMISAVRAVYGDTFDAERYLRRFVDVKFWLPVVDHAKFATNVVHSYGFRNSNGQRDERIAEFLVQLMAGLDFKARDVEQAAAACRLLYDSIEGKPDHVIFPCLTMCIFRFLDPDIVSNILSTKTPFKQLLDHIAALGYSEKLNSSVAAWESIARLFLYADSSRELLTQQANQGNADALWVLNQRPSKIPLGGKLWIPALQWVR